MSRDGSRLPDELLGFVHRRLGKVATTESLFGVAGDGAAVRLELESGNSVIVKSSPLRRERTFYENHAEHIRRMGVGVAELYGSGFDDTGRYWIVMEDIPKPFPQERWVCDREQFEMLFSLHSGTWGDKMPTLDAGVYRPGWDDEMTRRACKWFEDELEQSHVENLLTKMQRHAQVLFEPTCCISADPNPTNWRIRNSGELVLIDWERFSPGHPAIDLAITMPGLGSKDGTMESSIAELYRECWEKNMGSVPVELSELKRLIRVAKLWSVVEFLANARVNSELYLGDTVAYIVRELPEFLYALPK